MKSFRTLLSESIIGSTDEMFIVLEGEEAFDLQEESLDEAAGALAGIPKNITKTMTSTYGGGAGEHSTVTIHQAKNKSNLHSAIADGMAAGHHVVIKKHGKVLGSIHNATGSSSKHTQEVMTPDAAVSQTETRHIRGKYRGGRMEPDHSYKYERKSFTKGEAVDKAKAMVDAAGGYDGVEVHHISKDAERAKKREERNPSMANRPKVEPGTTRSLKDVAHRAATKLVDKYADSAGSAHAKAKELHAQLGKAIEAGDHRTTRKLIGDLNNHVTYHGLDKHSYDQEEAVRHAGSTGGQRLTSPYRAREPSYDAEQFVRHLRKVKGTDAQ